MRVKSYLLSRLREFANGMTGGRTHLPIPVVRSVFFFQRCRSLIALLFSLQIAFCLIIQIEPSDGVDSARRRRADAQRTEAGVGPSTGRQVHRRLADGQFQAHAIFAVDESMPRQSRQRQTTRLSVSAISR